MLQEMLDDLISDAGSAVPSTGRTSDVDSQTRPSSRDGHEAKMVREPSVFPAVGCQ